MKLKLNEFKEQLKLLKTLPAGEARTALLNSMKSAEVVEVDEKGVETPVVCEIVDEADAKAAAPVVDTKAIEQIVDDKLKAIPPAKAPIHQPSGEGKKMVIPTSAKRLGRVKNFVQREVNGYAPEERAYRFGMWGYAVAGVEAAKAWCAENGIAIVKLHSENVNTSGGVFVPEEFGTDLIDLKETYGVARRILQMVPMTSDTKTEPRRTGGLIAYPAGEGAPGTESTTGWDQVRLTAKDWMVLSRVTNQLSMDAVINFGDRLAYEIAYAFALKEDQCAFIGDGSSTYAGIVGITQKLINVFGTGGGTGLIIQSGSAGWVNLVLADFDSMVGALPQYADTPNAVWVCHRTFYYSVIEKLVQASGGVPAYEVRQGNRAPRPIFKGYPVEFSQVYPASYTTLTCPITLGDHGLAAMFGDRQQDQIAFSTEASIGGQSLFERNEMGVRGTERFDINVHDVGATGTAGPVVGLVMK